MSAVLRWCDTAGTFVLQAVDHPARQQLLEQWSRYAVMRSIKIELYVHGLEWETRLCFIFECANRKSLHHINQLFLEKTVVSGVCWGILHSKKKKLHKKIQDLLDVFLILEVLVCVPQWYAIHAFLLDCTQCAMQSGGPFCQFHRWHSGDCDSSAHAHWKDQLYHTEQGAGSKCQVFCATKRFGSDGCPQFCLLISSKKISSVCHWLNSS